MNSTSPLTSKATRETVISIHHWSDKLLSFKSSRPTDYRFTPGQFARLGLLANGDIISRAYSICSSIDDDFLEYYLVLVPGGQFSEQLKDLKSGDTIWVEKFSYGFMTVDRFTDGNDLWMMATGTGLGPFISILQAPAVWRKFDNLILVHSVKQAEELTYQDLLRSLPQRPQLAAGGARLQLLQTTTGHTTQTSHLQGRITTLLSNGQLEVASGLPVTTATSRIMICGNPNMVTEVREILHQRGLRPCRRVLPGQFVTEDYW